MMVVHVLTPTPDFLTPGLPLLMQWFQHVIDFNYICITFWSNLCMYCVSNIGTGLIYWSIITSCNTLFWILSSKLFLVGSVLVSREMVRDVLGWYVVIISMVFAHWCYFGAGILNVIFMKGIDEVTTTMSDRIHRCSILKSMPANSLSNYEETNDEEIAWLNWLID